MERKLLAMDLDGTAVCDDYSMSPISKQAILHARELGHVVVFVTGRRDIDMLTLGEDRFYVDYHILNTGGKILRCSDQAVLHNELIVPQACKKIIDYCFEKDLQLQICSAMTWQVTCMTEGTLEYAREVGVLPEVIQSAEDTDWRNGFEGLMATRDWDGVAHYIDTYASEDMYYVNSEPGTIDIMPTGVSKWKGISLLADMLGIDKKNIITVGNYYNDMDMLQQAPVGIAVANSLEPVKEIADFVTERDNNHDAVAEIIENMINGVYDVP